MKLSKNEYNKLHKWMLRTYKKTGKCEHCHKKRPTQWANKTNDYLKDRDNWLELCVQCHATYDSGGMALYMLLTDNELKRNKIIENKIAKQLLTGVIY